VLANDFAFETRARHSPVASCAAMQKSEIPSEISERFFSQDFFAGAQKKSSHFFLSNSKAVSNLKPLAGRENHGCE
jgi:hypothetical protein